MCLVRGTLPYDLWDEKSENANKWFSLQSYVNVSTLIFSVIHSWSKCSEEKNTIHQRLSLHTRNCPSSSWGWTYCKTTRKEELGESHRCINFLVYKPFHVLVFAVCEREREEKFHMICEWMNEWMEIWERVKKQISDFRHHHMSMYLLSCFAVLHSCCLTGFWSHDF
jgi:hypothetical protein